MSTSADTTFTTAHRAAGEPARGAAAPPGTVGGSGGPRSAPPTRLRPSRMATVVVLIAGLVVASLTREWAMALQDLAAQGGPFYASPASAAGGTSNHSAIFGSMDSFALALLLGGLRGPLVMFLWVTSESQKNERDLEDFDTKIELIRLLQPEFDTVHVFQIWNKAYNISAQLASLPHKYAAILDALEYARNVDQARPNDMNILLAIEQLYAGKLGGTTNDKVYYERRSREETRLRPDAANREAGARRRMEPILDEAGNLLPRVLVATHPRPPGLAATVFVPKSAVEAFNQAAAAAGVKPLAVTTAASDGDQTVTLDEAAAHKLEDRFDPAAVRYAYPDWNDGGEMQYLKAYQPFPYGVPPLALGFNYAKRAQVLMVATGQKPLQVSRSVVDSKPALDLRLWSDAEQERAVQFELKALGRPTPPSSGPDTQRIDSAYALAGVRLADPIVDPSAAEAAKYEYALIARLSRDSRDDYERHLSSTDNYINKFQDYGSEIDALIAQEHLAIADHDFLAAMLAGPGAERDRAIGDADEHYRHAVTWYRYIDLRYYVPAEVANPLYPPGVTRATLYTLRDQQLGDPHSNVLNILHTRVLRAIAASRSTDMNNNERRDYGKLARRALARRQTLAAALHGTTAPSSPEHEPTDTPPAEPDSAVPFGPAGPMLGPATKPRPAAATAPATLPNSRPAD